MPRPPGARRLTLAAVALAFTAFVLVVAPHRTLLAERFEEGRPLPEVLDGLVFPDRVATLTPERSVGGPASGRLLRLRFAPGAVALTTAHTTTNHTTSFFDPAAARAALAARRAELAGWRAVRVEIGPTPEAWFLASAIEVLLRGGQPPEADPVARYTVVMDDAGRVQMVGSPTTPGRAPATIGRRPAAPQAGTGPT